MKINAHGFWEDMSVHDVSKEHAFDSRLCQAITQFFIDEHATTIVDLGCGSGLYTNALNNEHMTCDGFDGNPNTPVLTESKCNILDLSQMHTFETPYHWVLSLEVGEHLPKEFEEKFIDNICNACERGMVISWAVKGQGGMGHVNCQNNDYVRETIEQKGFLYDVESSNHFRKKCQLSWFRNTVMVFRKKPDV